MRWPSGARRLVTRSAFLRCRPALPARRGVQRSRGAVLTRGRDVARWQGPLVGPDRGRAVRSARASNSDFHHFHWRGVWDEASWEESLHSLVSELNLALDAASQTGATELAEREQRCEALLHSQAPVGSASLAPALAEVRALIHDGHAVRAREVIERWRASGVLDAGDASELGRLNILALLADNKAKDALETGGPSAQPAHHSARGCCDRGALRPALGPESSGATQPGAGFGNLLAPIESAVWNSEMFSNSKPPTVATMKPAGNANVGSNSGTPGRGAVSKDAAAPVQEVAPLGGTNSGPDAPCNRGSNPRCGTTAERLPRIGKSERAVDALAYLWQFTQIPNGPHDGRMLPNVMEAGGEYTAAIIVDRNGIPRLSRTYEGGLQESEVPAEKLQKELRPGDTIIGTVHNHPILATDKLHFSVGDIEKANKFMNVNRAFVNPSIGVNYYVVSPGQALVFEVGGKITPLGF